MKILCLDAEFAVMEILELSVWEMPEWPDSDIRRQSYHGYFRPVRERRWPGSQRVHHISPEMVAAKPPFRTERHRLQQLIDSADLIVGFAIDNDLEALAREGITGLDRKPSVDVRDLFWLAAAPSTREPLESRKGLAWTAGELGVEFSEKLAHGADYDTRVTLKCFETLMQGYRTKGPAGERGQETLARYFDEWDREREAYAREFAKGYIALIPGPNGSYRVRSSRQAPDTDKALTVIRVAARNRAMDEIDARFDKRRNPHDSRTYLLKPVDIEWFENYSNEYDSQEHIHKKMLELRQNAARR